MNNNYILQQQIIPILSVYLLIKFVDISTVDPPLFVVAGTYVTMNNRKPRDNGIHQLMK